MGRPCVRVRARRPRDHRGGRVQAAARAAGRAGHGCAGRLGPGAARRADRDRRARRAALFQPRQAARRLRRRGAARLSAAVLAGAALGRAGSGDGSPARSAGAMPALHGEHRRRPRAGRRRRRRAGRALEDRVPPLRSHRRLRVRRHPARSPARRMADRRDLRADARDPGLVLGGTRRPRPAAPDRASAVVEADRLARLLAARTRGFPARHAPRDHRSPRRRLPAMGRPRPGRPRLPRFSQPVRRARGVPDRSGQGRGRRRRGLPDRHLPAADRRARRGTVANAVFTVGERGDAVARVRARAPGKRLPVRRVAPGAARPAPPPRRLRGRFRASSAITRSGAARGARSCSSGRRRRSRSR